jgi:hypothetical protein
MIMSWLGQSLASYYNGQGSVSSQTMQDLWWTKWKRGRSFFKYFTSPLPIIIPPNVYSLIYQHWLAQ